MDTRLAMQTAFKVRDTKPATAEGELALAAWRRCLHAFMSMGMLHPEDRRAFLAIVGEED